MSKRFERTRRKAEQAIKDPVKRKKLLDTAVKLSKPGKHTSQLSEISGKVQSLARMLRCYFTKEYTDVPWQTIVLVAAALIYFVSPFDAIADFIPLIGFADDIAIVSAVFASIIQDVDRFTAWEAAKAAGAEPASYTLIENQ
ncbi:YkvA family protein [Chlorobium sp. KB01]|uniref:YkvA family protein n=1 Tax=Chlorobium sp. KB01 TaxID=1917528 RepID=UPI0009788284|nr:YkvA family protein [Chlorobium sp. KB01]